MTIKSNLDINQVKPPLNSSFGVHYANKEKEAMDLRERAKEVRGDDYREEREGRNHAIIL